LEQLAETLRKAGCLPFSVSSLPDMKTFLSLSLALAALVPSHAQSTRREAVNGVAIGAVAGAVIGNNSGSLGHSAWRGAAYGAGAGLLVGSAIGHANRRAEAHRPTVYHPGYHRPSVFYSDFHRPHYGYGYFSRPSFYRPYVYRSEPVYYYDASDTYVAARPNYAGSGLFLGALAGAIIGNNSGSLGHNAWRGAAYGAGAGLLIGSIAESRARRAESAEAAAATLANAAAAPAAPATSVGQQATTIINNNYYNSPAPTTPMSAANSMFGRN
jgi:uncharacterized protein YcfJ